MHPVAAAHESRASGIKSSVSYLPVKGTRSKKKLLAVTVPFWLEV
jgi:hypothetical protein